MKDTLHDNYTHLLTSLSFDVGYAIAFTIEPWEPYKT